MYTASISTNIKPLVTFMLAGGNRSTQRKYRLTINHLFLSCLLEATGVPVPSEMPSTRDI